MRREKTGERRLAVLSFGAVVGLIGFAGMAVPGMAAEGQGIRAGSATVYPSLKVEEKYNDNLFMQEKASSIAGSWITTIEPGLKLGAKRNTGGYEIDYHLTKGIYHGSRTDDFVDHFVGLNVFAAPTYRLDYKIGVSHNRAHDDRGSTFTGKGISFNTPDQYHETLANAEINYGVNAVIQLKGEYSNKRYDNHHTLTRSRDLNIEGGSIQFTYPIAPKTRVALEARLKHFDYKLFTATTNLDSNEQRYFAGLDWEATAKTTGKVRVGYLHKSFRNPKLSNASFLSWEVNVSWQPLSYSTWNLSTSSTPKETDGTGNYTKDTNVNLAWNHAWSSYVSHHASVGYSRDIFKGSKPERTDKTTSASFGMDYKFRRWLTLGAEYDYHKRSSNTANASYRQNIWLVRIQGAL